MSKIWLLVYDSESDCDLLIGVFTTKEKAINRAIYETKKIFHNKLCVKTCDCGDIDYVDKFNTKSMSWGPAICIGGFYYIVEKDLL